MIEFSIHQLFPEFILADKNGYAMAKAIEMGMNILCAAVQDGMQTARDVDTMPEWQLDEMAWAYNIPYDYDADISIKRSWIRNAGAMSALYGTPEGITQYMAGYFSDAVLEESNDYGGEPFHFRMIFPGSWTTENVAWSHKAIHAVKNVRSVLDGCTYNEQWRRALYAGCALYRYEHASYPIHTTGIDADCYADEDGEMLLDERGYPLIVEE